MVAGCRVFVGFLITRTYLGEPAHDVGEARKAGADAEAVPLARGFGPLGFVSTQAARRQDSLLRPSSAEIQTTILTG